MKSIITLLSLFLFFHLSQAQTKNGRISGSVKDASAKAVEGGTVSLHKSKDSSLVKVALTNKQGDYEFEKIAEGKYFVRVTAVGLNDASSNPFEITSINNSVQLTEFQLAPAGKSLGEVTVSARRPFIENKIDRTVVNVDAQITNAGNSALETLEKSPGVSVDNDGNISLKGKQGVIILIDGKQTYLSATDLANYLRNLPANQLDQIEIMTQPPAKFDASGNSGVINFKTKRSTQKGYNGNLSIGMIQAVYPKIPTSFNFNYRKNKVNIFANYSFTFWQGFSEIGIERYIGRTTPKDFLRFFDQHTSMKFQSPTHTLRTGLDFYADKNTTLGFALSTFQSSSLSSAIGTSALYDAHMDLLSTTYARTRNEGPWKNYAANLNFRKVLNKKGTELSSDVDVIYYDTRTKQQSNNYTYDADGDLSPTNSALPVNPFLLSGNLPSIIRIYTAKADFSHPLKNNAKFEAGWKSSVVNNDNDAQYSYVNANGDLVNDANRSNHFLYKENINAVYVNYSKQFKKWGVQTGLRMEQTNSKGDQVTQSKKFDTSYAQLFPTFYLTHTPNKNNTFTLSYSRRVERPNYQDLNPFQYFLDQYTYRQGNPGLRPQFSHNVELAYNFKGQLNVSWNISKTSDIINDILKQNDSTNVTFQTKENIASRTNIGLGINYNKQLKKWWTASVFVNAFNNHFEGVVNNKNLSVDVATFMFNANNQLKFNKGWGAEVSGFYRSKILASGIIVGRPMGVISFGVSKQIMKTKGTLRLNISDPFYIQKFRGYTKFDNIDARIRSRWDNRRVGMTFSYRFSKGQNVQARKRNSASQDEQNRVGSGGQQQ